ncbi:hypothetical protein F4779DRAFT_632864 [Xylariaceae sp. FL0662B]|nr:hypothetical protein F4779DRAFT_632864 [Xylariaceae sp. FL0662B]
MSSLHSSAHPGAIERLPEEVLAMILRYLPDVRSLKSAVLSAKVFHIAFSPVKENITAQVRLNEIDPTVLRLAAIAVKAESDEAYNEEQCNDFIKQHLRPELPIPDVFSRAELYKISALHGCIEDLAVEFGSWALSKAPGFPSKFTGPPSRAEMSRIQRAFYLYHIAFTLYPRIPLKRGPGRQYQYHIHTKIWDLYGKFSAYENSQKKAVGIFLGEVCEPSFDALVPIRPMCRCGRMRQCPLYEEYLMSAGIPKIHPLFKGTADQGSLYIDLVTITRDRDHGKEETGFLLELWREQFTSEDTDPGPEMMCDISAYETLVFDYVYDVEWPEDSNWFQLDEFWDLERMEGMTGGRVHNYREHLGVGSP